MRIAIREMKRRRTGVRMWVSGGGDSRMMWEDG
jgi:hypothetical protein